MHPNFTKFDKIFETLNNEIKNFIGNRLEKRECEDKLEKQIKLFISSIEFLKVNKVSEKYVEYIKSSIINTKIQKTEESIAEYDNDLQNLNVL